MCSSAESATYLTIVPTAKTKHNGSFGTEFRGGGACLGTVAGTTATNSPRTSAATASRATVCIDICFDADGWRVRDKEQFNTPFRTCVTRSRERVGLHRRGGTRVPCFGREALGPYDSREPIAGIVRAAKVPLPAFSVFAWESTEFTRIN